MRQGWVLAVTLQAQVKGLLELPHVNCAWLSVKRGLGPQASAALPFTAVRCEGGATVQTLNQIAGHTYAEQPSHLLLAFDFYLLQLALLRLDGLLGTLSLSLCCCPLLRKLRLHLQS